MIIKIDKHINWEHTAGDLDDSQLRRYYAAPSPWLAVLVLREELIGNTAEELYGAIFDCSIGNHPHNAPIGYTLPQFQGWTHSKLTLREEMTKGTPHDITLTEFLAGCPTSDMIKTEERYRNFSKTGEPLNVYLPRLLRNKASQLANLHGHDLESLTAHLLLKFVLDNER